MALSTAGLPASESLAAPSEAHASAQERIALVEPAMRWAALLALTACVCAAAWIAVGAADGRYLLELPTGANPAWADGPLRGLNGLVGSLGPDGLSVALIVLGCGYMVALSCATAIPLRAALAAVVIANLAFTLGPTIVSSDAFGYIAYAREVASHGFDPYISPPTSLGHDPVLLFVYWKHQQSPYGPLFTALSAPLGLLTVPAALWLLKAAAGLTSIGLAFVVASLAGRRGLNPARAAIFVGLNPVLLFYAVSGAHNDLLAAALVVCALAVALEGRERAAGALAAAAAAVKLTAGLALPFIVLASARRGRAALGATLTIVAIAVPALLLFGTSIIDQLHRISSDPLFDTAFSGPDRFASLLGTQITTAVRFLCMGTAAAVALFAIWRARRGADPIAAAGWALLALIASIASLAPWYIVWLLPLAALAHGRALQLATLLASAYLILVHLPALGGLPWLSQAGAGAGAGGGRIALVPGVYGRVTSAARPHDLHAALARVRDEHQPGAFVDRHRVGLAAGRV